MIQTRQEQALELSEEILENLELEVGKLQISIQKTLRLARFINDMEAVEWLREEMKGFTRDEEGLLTGVAWKSARRSNRISYNEVKEQETAAIEQVSVMEATIEALKARMQVSYDPDVSLSTQSTINPFIAGNKNERHAIARDIQSLTGKIEGVKSAIYDYVFNVNYELKFSNITEDIYTRKRTEVDKKLAEVCPEAIQKFISVYDNLKSKNDEDWANAVHSCRRILKDVADVLYPPAENPIKLGNGKEIKIGEEQVINRLIQYVDSKSSSKRFEELVGSHLKYIGERLDGIYGAVNKGTHTEVSLEEAERYIIYTYLLIGDILSL